jgi:hypothetical protein
MIVGSEKTEFTLTKNSLCHHSAFFHSACKKDWKSGVTKTVLLEDKDPMVFSLFAAWVETGHIGNSEDYVEVNYSEAEENQTASQREKDQKDSEAQLYQLAQCFVLGDNLQSSTFCNYIHDTMVAAMGKRADKFDHSDDNRMDIPGSTKDTLDFIFTNTVFGSALRKLVLDQLLNMSPQIKTYDITKSVGLQDFYIELCQLAILALRDSDYSHTAPWERNVCKAYHKHDTGEFLRCYKGEFCEGHTY